MRRRRRLWTVVMLFAIASCGGNGWTSVEYGFENLLPRIRINDSGSVLALVGYFDEISSETVELVDVGGGDSTTGPTTVVGLPIGGVAAMDFFPGNDGRLLCGVVPPSPFGTLPGPSVLAVVSDGAVSATILPMPEIDVSEGVAVARDGATAVVAARPARTAEPTRLVAVDLGSGEVTEIGELGATDPHRADTGLVYRVGDGVGWLDDSFEVVARVVPAGIHVFDLLGTRQGHAVVEAYEIADDTHRAVYEIDIFGNVTELMSTDHILFAWAPDTDVVAGFDPVTYPGFGNDLPRTGVSVMRYTAPTG